MEKVEEEVTVQIGPVAVRPEIWVRPTPFQNEEELLSAFKKELGCDVSPLLVERADGKIVGAIIAYKKNQKWRLAYWRPDLAVPTNLRKVKEMKVEVPQIKKVKIKFLVPDVFRVPKRFLRKVEKRVQIMSPEAALLLKTLADAGEISEKAFREEGEPHLARISVELKDGNTIELLLRVRKTQDGLSVELQDFERALEMYERGKTPVEKLVGFLLLPKSLRRYMLARNSLSRIGWFFAKQLFSPTLKKRLVEEKVQEVLPYLLLHVHLAEYLAERK